MANKEMLAYRKAGFYFSINCSKHRQISRTRSDIIDFEHQGHREDKRIIRNLITQLMRRDFMPVAAAFALGLSIGDKATAWLIDGISSGIPFLAAWPDSPAFEWQSRLVMGLLFLVVMALVVRKVG